MNILCLPTKQLFGYELTGKFKAPSADWTHQSLPLTNYELIVMTEGILYLSYNNENFIVRSGEYLLLPPGPSWRQGFRPSYCAFYWLHFTTPSDDLPLILTPDTVLPPPGQLFFPSTDRKHSQTRKGCDTDETTAGYRQKQLSVHGARCHVYQHRGGTVWSVDAGTSCGKFF